MKPPPFEYYAPQTREEALALLAQYGDEAKVLAGGQSLVPTMNFRLAAPAILVDLNGVADLFGIWVDYDDSITIRAMTRQRTVERDAQVARFAPLLTETLPYIAHPQIRNRGTFGGSLAHNDPAAELPAVALTLGTGMRVQSTRGQRMIPASEFFQGLFTTALEPDELLVEIVLPAPWREAGVAFAEFSRRHGDYALVGAVAWVLLDDDGTVANSRLVFFAVGDGPVESAAAYNILLGQAPTSDAIAAAVAAADGDIDPPTDIHATAAYRRHLAGVLARQTLTRAVERAQQGLRNEG